MALKPDPVRELLELQERMNRLFDATLGRERLDDAPVLQASWLPVADVFETPDGYVVEIELPGLRQDEIQVQAQGSDLLVRGERRPSPEGRPEIFHRLERRHGPFTRSFRFPDEVDAGRVTAELEEGVLRVSVPKLRPDRPRHVPIARGE